MNAVLIDRLRRLGASSDYDAVNNEGRVDRLVEVPVWILDELLTHLDKRRRGRQTTKIGRRANRIVEALADAENTISKTELLARASKAMRLNGKEVKSLRSSVDRKLRQQRGP